MKRFLSFVTLAAATFWVPPGAEAQFIPTLVNDPLATVATWNNGRMIDDHRRSVLRQIATFRQTLQSYGDLPYREIQSIVTELEDYMYTAGGLGYQLGNLEAQFQAIYDGGQVYVDDLLLALDQDLEQIDTTLRTVEGTLMTMQGHMDQLHDSAGELEAYKDKLLEAGLSATKIEQAGAAVRSYGAQELQLLRQTLMAQVNLEAVVVSNELSDKAEALRDNAESSFRILTDVYAVPIPPAPSISF